jgi:hypothetical protein
MHVQAAQVLCTRDARAYAAKRKSSSLYPISPLYPSTLSSLALSLSTPSLLSTPSPSLPLLSSLYPSPLSTTTTTTGTFKSVFNAFFALEFYSLG